MFLMAMAAAAAVPGTGGAMAAAYDTLCTGQDSSPTAVLALADRAGWRSAGPGMPDRFDPAFDRFTIAGDATLELDVRETIVRDERLASCGISTPIAVPGLVADVQAMLGFAPALNLATSATFFALREDGQWRDAKAVSRAEFAAAKAAGKFYSIVAAGTEKTAALVSLRIRPAAGG
jgi:hypothetical protein